MSGGIGQECRMLSGKEIEHALDEDDPKKRLVVVPLFSRSEQIDRGAASMDLHLGCRFSAAKRRQHSHFKFGMSEVHPRALVDQYYVPLGGKFLLHPRHFVLATTLEWLRLPPVLGGYVVGRSSLGRRGLIIATAAGVHPNYSGVLTLELTNVAEIPLEITPGQSICQLFLHRISSWEDQAVDKSVYLGSLYPQLGRSSPNSIDQFLMGIDDGESV